MSVPLLPWPRAKFFAPNTNYPLAGGKVYTYVAGTNTPLATYASFTGMIANTNPVILDANGEAPIYLANGLSYKINVTDASDVQIPGYPVDNIYGAGFREKLTAPRSYYVRPDGSNSNNGLTNTAGGAFLTIQKAIDVLRNDVDLNGFGASIQVADGTYTAGGIVQGEWIGSGAVYIFGNINTPANCIINATSADCFQGNSGAVFGVRGFKTTTTTSGNCITAYSGSQITTQLMEFGACAGSHIEVGTGSALIVDGDYAISGGAVAHYHVGSEGMIAVSAVTVTMSNAPAWGAYFAGCAFGSIVIPQVTFTSTFGTGPFFLAHKNGTIDIGSHNVNSYLPGNSAGTTNTGGIIATTDRSWTPTLTFATPGDLAVTYTSRVGSWSRTGDVTTISCDIVTSSFTYTTASGAIQVAGLPFNAKNVTGVNSIGNLQFQGITKAAYSQFSPGVGQNSTTVGIVASGSGQPLSVVSATDAPSGGAVILRFSISYLSATT